MSSFSSPPLSSSSHFQFVLNPTPLSYALPPGVDMIPEGLARSLSGFWPVPVPSTRVTENKKMKKFADSMPAGGNDHGEAPSRKASSSKTEQVLLKRKTSSAGKEQARTSSNELEMKQPNDLPDGFEVEVHTRKGGKTAGHKDKYYIEKGSGTKFRSMAEVFRYLETGSAKKPKQVETEVTSDAVPAEASSSAVEDQPNVPENNTVSNNQRTTLEIPEGHAGAGEQTL